MKNILLLLLGFFLLTGCAHRYDIFLINGDVITHVSKPKFDQKNSIFTFTDIKGRKRYINAGRVVEIAPHKDVKGPVSPNALPVTTPPSAPPH